MEKRGSGGNLSGLTQFSECEKRTAEVKYERPYFVGMRNHVEDERHAPLVADLFGLIPSIRQRDELNALK